MGKMMFLIKFQEYLKKMYSCSRAFMEQAKIILKLIFVIQNGKKNVKFDSGCTGWQSMPQNMLNINLPNFSG